MGEKNYDDDNDFLKFLLDILSSGDQDGDNTDKEKTEEKEEPVKEEKKEEKKEKIESTEEKPRWTLDCSTGASSDGVPEYAKGVIDARIMMDAHNALRKFVDLYNKLVESLKPRECTLWTSSRMVGMYRCSKCEKLSSEMTKFCPHCGRYASNYRRYFFGESDHVPSR